jgi:hypothetical protein
LNGDSNLSGYYPKGPPRGKGPVGGFRPGTVRSVAVTAPFGSAAYDPEAAELLVWPAPGIARVFGLRFADIFGSFGIARERGRVEQNDGNTCLVGGFFAIDVEGLEDIDADVELRLTVNREAADSLLVGYDANGTPENLRRVAVPGPERWTRVTVRLERARFAGRGPRGTDLLLGAPGADFTGTNGDPDKIVLAAIELKPVGDIAPEARNAHLDLVVRDEHGEPTAARVGIYDAGGREVLPGLDGVPIGRYGEDVRHVALRSISALESTPEGPREAWPVANRWVMYVDGHWGGDVAAGTYDLVLMKGPEYRWVTRRIAVAPGTTHREEVRMQRWIDLPATGWRSGDAHIHLARNTAKDDAILKVANAEDVHVANLLRMGNLTQVAYEQGTFGAQGWAHEGAHHLASGQEDPRTGRRGHTLHLNVAEPVRDPDRYFLYHETFERLRADGAITGYAHAGTTWFDELAGLALDIPFGLVDLIEVAQAGLRTDPWYDFLNLGYRITPVAGSDWPYINTVGTVRSYVHVGEARTMPGWFEGLRAGRTFVTNGPLLRLDVGEAGMGDQIDAKPGTQLRVQARADLSPDRGPLERFELVVHGDVVATGELEQDGASARLEHRLAVTGGMWFAVRAFGSERSFAHSAPVYVPVNEGTWRVDAAETIVGRMRASMDRLISSEPDVWAEDLEPWDTEETYASTWARLLPELAQRVAGANRRYEDLLERIARSLT